MYCKYCGNELPTETTEICPSCNAPVISSPIINSPPRQEPTSTLAIMTLVMGALGIAACCGMSPIAVVLGYIELKRIKAGTSSASGKAITLSGFILGIAGLVIGLVAILGIGLAILIPNFYNSQSKTKTSQSKADLRTLATAVESYYVDFSFYPISMTKLTSPIAYISGIPCDPYSEGKKEPYFYCAGPENSIYKSYYIFAGRGPDGELGPNGDASILKNFTPEKGFIGSGIIEYDPTNGTCSAGDILRSIYFDTSTVSSSNHTQTVH